jgi:hypothetical protein
VPDLLASILSTVHVASSSFIFHVSPWLFLFYPKGPQEEALYHRHRKRGPEEEGPPGDRPGGQCQEQEELVSSFFPASDLDFLLSLLFGG